MRLVDDVQDGRNRYLVEYWNSQEDIRELDEFGKVPTGNIVDVAPAEV